MPPATPAPSTWRALWSMLRPMSLPRRAGRCRRDVAGIELDVELGFGPLATDVPDALRHAIRLLVAHWYENRGMAATGAGVAMLPSGASRAVEADADSASVRERILLRGNFALTLQHRLVDGAKIYRIVSLRDIDDRRF